MAGLFGLSLPSRDLGDSRPRIEAAHGNVDNRPRPHPSARDSPLPLRAIHAGTRPIGIPDACASSKALFAQRSLIGREVLARITAEYDLFEIGVLGKELPH
jgi:hypothetical protein